MAKNLSASSSSSNEEDNAPSNESQGVEAWIDQNAKQSSLKDLIAYLAAITLPSDLSNSRGTVNPFSRSLDGQLWPWNRVAHHLAEAEKYREAAEINAAMYLAIVALQTKFKQRLHKGMPLCNVGYFLARANQVEVPSKAWLLGLAEDVFTDPASASQKLNYKNLATTRLPHPALLSYLTTVEARFVKLSVTPLMPEVVPLFWTTPLLETPPQQALTAVDYLIAEATKSYPNLPNEPLEILCKAWEFLPAPAGVAQ